MRDFVHFYISELLFAIASLLMVPSSIHLFSSPLLFDFHLSEPLRLESYLIFHFIFLLNPVIILQFLLFILFFKLLLKTSLLLFLKMQGILDFLLFLVPLLWNHVIILTHLSFLLIFKLDVKDFLQENKYWVRNCINRIWII